MTFLILTRTPPHLDVFTFEAADANEAQRIAGRVVPKKFAREFQVLPVGQWEEQGK